MNPAPPLSSAANAFPPPRVTPNLKHAFAGIFRLTLRRYGTVSHWLTFAIMLGVLVVMLLGNVGHRGDTFYTWMIMFYLSFLVPAVAFVNAGGALRDELKPSVTDYVLTRPVPRPAFMIFRYISHVACTQFDFLLAFGVVIGLGALRDIPGVLAALPLLLLAQVLLIAAFSALGFLCAVLTSRYVIVGLLYGAAIEVGVGQIPTQLSRLSMTQQIRGMLRELTEIPLLSADPLGPWGASVLALAFSAVMLGLAAGIFSIRELIGKNDA